MGDVLLPIPPGQIFEIFVLDVGEVLPRQPFKVVVEISDFMPLAGPVLPSNAQPHRPLARNEIKD